MQELALCKVTTAGIVLMNDDEKEVKMHDDGGPAFPIYLVFPGMTLRDCFASAAMQGITIADKAEIKTAEEIAKDAYEIADAMIAERRK